MIAHRPSGDVPVPRRVADIAGRRRVTVVWQNELGGLTCQIGTGPRRIFVKWNPASTGIDLAAEVARLTWAATYTPVPRVLEYLRHPEASLLVTAGLPGESVVEDRWKRDPATAVTAIGHGLRAFHDRLPVADCPFSWSADDRLNDARRRGYSAETLAKLARPPAVDRVVVCHGDACAPNTLIGAEGRWCGHVDLGELGVGDRWSDLAVATWSLDWNYGPGWQPALLAAYGVAADPLRIDYYRGLWEIGP